MQKQYKTGDGFTFTLQSDGTLTDGDTVFDSLDELKKHANMQEIETPLMETLRFRMLAAFAMGLLWIKLMAWAA